MESTLRRTAEHPKLATRREAGVERRGLGLTEHSKRCKTERENSIPGSKHRSESPAMLQTHPEQPWLGVVFLGRAPVGGGARFVTVAGDDGGRCFGSWS